MSTTYTSVANSVAAYLAAQSYPEGITLVAGVSIFSEIIPDKPDTCVAVFERPGASPLMTLTGTGQPQSLIDRPQIQIRVRSAMDAYALGNTITQQVWGALQGLANQQLPSGGMQFLLINAAGFPMSLGQDTQQRYEWSLNLSCILDNSQRILA